MHFQVDFYTQRNVHLSGPLSYFLSVRLSISRNMIIFLLDSLVFHICYLLITLIILISCCCFSCISEKFFLCANNSLFVMSLIILGILFPAFSPHSWIISSLSFFCKLASCILKFIFSVRSTFSPLLYYIFSYHQGLAFLSR